MNDSDSTYSRLQDAAEAVRARSRLQPHIALVLGSGLGGLAAEVSDGTVIPYSEIPHFPRSTAPGHAGQLVLGTLEGQPVAALSGRAHLYEGYEPESVVFAVRLMRMLGAEVLIITNAAGAVNVGYTPGQLMIIADHINLTGRSPLMGANDVRLGVRFPDMSFAYDPELRALTRSAATDLGIDIVEGVYMGLLGPSYETPAEIRACRALGADAVGMSTVLEVIAAHAAGTRVLGISCMTNMAAGILPQKLTEEEVIETAKRVRDEFAGLVRAVIGRLEGKEDGEDTRI